MSMCVACQDKDREIIRLRSFLSAKQRRQMQDENAHSHAGDPETSHFAALCHSGPKRWASRRRVLEALILAYDLGGAIDDEMLTLLDLPDESAYSTFRTCRGELRDLLLVRDSGVKRGALKSKKPCVVWQIAHPPDVIRARFEEMVVAAERRRQALRAT